MAKRPSGRGRRRPARSSLVLRWLAVAVTAFVGFLYYRPVQVYLETREAVQVRQAEVRALRAEKRRLERRVVASASTEALVLEARKLGLVKPGERLFIVKGISDWRALVRRAERKNGDRE